MTSQCGPPRPNLNETKMRRRYDVVCRVGTPFLFFFFRRLNLSTLFISVLIFESLVI